MAHVLVFDDTKNGLPFELDRVIHLAPVYVQYQ